LADGCIRWPAASDRGSSTLTPVSSTGRCVRTAHPS
jgi:hypothetical protein